MSEKEKARLLRQVQEAQQRREKMRREADVQLRDAVQSAMDSGLTRREISRQLGIHEQNISRILKKV